MTGQLNLSQIRRTDAGPAAWFVSPLWATSAFAFVPPDSHLGQRLACRGLRDIFWIHAKYLKVASPVVSSGTAQSNGNKKV